MLIERIFVVKHKLWGFATHEKDIHSKRKHSKGFYNCGD